MLEKIEHFVVLMMENRSFDHMLGYSGIKGTNLDTGKIDGILGLEPDGKVKQLAADGSVVELPVTADADYVMPFDPGHEFEDVKLQLCGTKNDYDQDGAVTNWGFVLSASRSAKVDFETARRVLAAFTPDRLPVLTGLAREFAVCDRWHSSIPGPTWPNRFFVHAATSGGLIASPSPSGALDGKKYDWDTIPGFSFKGGTIYEALDSHRDDDWRVYHGDNLPQVMELRGMTEKLLFSSCFRRFERFTDDLAKEGLPSYTFIEPDHGDHSTSVGANSQHAVSDVRDGERLIKTIYEALRGSPLWEKTCLIVTYDEHGGFYDHINPGIGLATGDDDQFNGDPEYFSFGRLGVRVPTVIISAYTKNIVDHEIYDHTSILATVEKRFKLGHLTQRDANAKTFEKLFHLDVPRQDAPKVLRSPEEGSAPPHPMTVSAMQTNPVEHGTGSFLRLAKNTDLAMSPERRSEIEERVRTIKTKAEAARYIAEVQRKVKSRKSDYLRKTQ